MTMLTIKRPGVLAIVGICVRRDVERMFRQGAAGRRRRMKRQKRLPVIRQDTPVVKEESKELPPFRSVRSGATSAEAKISEAIKQAATKPHDLAAPLVDNLATSRDWIRSSLFGST